LKNNSALQAWDATYSNKKNLISRVNDVLYDNEVVVGDSGVRTALRAENDTYDPIVRKGTYGFTTDYLIYTSEHFDYTQLEVKGHMHNISDIHNLQNSLDSKLNLSGGTLEGDLIFPNNNFLFLPGAGRGLVFNDIQVGSNVLISNINYNDDIISITKQVGIRNYLVEIFGQLLLNDGSDPQSATTKNYVDTNLNSKLDKTGGTITGELFVDDDVRFNKGLRVMDELDAGGGLITRQTPEYQGHSGIVFEDQDFTTFAGIYWTHDDKQFEIVEAGANPADPGFAIYHEGNLDIDNFVAKDTNQIMTGSLTINSGDGSNPSSLTVIDDTNHAILNGSSLQLDTSTSIFEMLNTGSKEIIFSFDGVDNFSLADTKAPTSFNEPTEDAHLTTKLYVDSNFLSNTGGIVEGNITLGDGTTDVYLNIHGKDANPNSGINFNRADGTTRFKLESDGVSGTANILLKNADGSADVGSLTLKPDGNVALIPGAVPNSPDDLINKSHLDNELNKKANLSYVDSTFLPFSGGVLTGDLTVQGDFRTANVFDDSAGNICILEKDYSGVNMSGLCFEDSSQSTSAGIWWDSGDQRFEIKEAGMSVSDPGYEIWHSGNFTPPLVFETTLSLTRMAIDQVVSDNNIDLNNTKQFILLTDKNTGSEEIYFVSYIETLDKFAVKLMDLL